MRTTLDQPTRNAVESFVTDWMNDDGVPCASLALVDGDDVVYADGFGARNVADNRPATSETLYGIGSITKSFTALAVQQLASDDRLSVRDPVGEYVDRYADVAGDPVTVRELLTHSSGFPSDGSAVTLITQLMGTEAAGAPVAGESDFDRVLAGAAGERVTDEDRFFYYNSGYTVLGEIVEAVSGQSYESYVEDHILDPLNMSRSTFDREAFEAAEDRMTPYYRDDDGLHEGAFPFDETVYAPGGLLSSVDELANYLRTNMSGGEFDGTRIVDEAALAEMHDPVSTRRVSLDGDEQRYGYGWMVSGLLEDRLVGHGGSIGVSNAYVGFLEEANIGVALCCATSPDTHPMTVGPAVLALLAGEDPAETVTHYGLDEKLEAVAGDYESYRGVHEASVERLAGGLRIERGTKLGTEELVAFPETGDPDDLRFYAVTGDGSRLSVEFERTPDGMELYLERWRLHRE